MLCSVLPWSVSANGGGEQHAIDAVDAIDAIDAIKGIDATEGLTMALIVTGIAVN